jgi:putative hydrolase of HD superfamily
MDDDRLAATKVLDFLPLAERLKFEMRHSWLSNGRQESVAEHTWFLILLAVLTHKRLEQPVDLGRVLAMLAVHDLGEAEIGDIPFFENSDRQAQKAAQEQAAMDRIAQMLPDPEGDTVRELWLEFEEGLTAEAKFARALDHLEVQAQHNLADFSTWEPVEFDLIYTKMDSRCAHDSFLKLLLSGIRNQAESKMINGDIDVTSIKDRLRKTNPEP